MMNQKGFLTDEELAIQASSGDSKAFDELAVRIRPILLRIARHYSISGLDSEDLIQEGYLGVLSALRCYQSHVGKFIPFAYVCAKSSIISAVRRFCSDKQKPLLDYVSLETDELLLDLRLSPEDTVAAQEQAKEIQIQFETVLSRFEQQTLLLFLAGHSYDEIANILSVDAKSVGNALQRARKKLRQIYTSSMVST